jgi:hypothetical protein
MTDIHPQTNTPWRSIVWGKGRMGFKGTSTAEVDTDFDTYVANRKRTGYVEQVRVKIYFPMEKIIKFIGKNIPKLIALVDNIRR